MNRYDDKKNYCRMLGHSVTFLYCRKTAKDTPCRKIRDCWFETLPIDEYLNDHFSLDAKQLIFREPEHKVTSLLDLIARARSRAEKPET
jgi:hypothetical protein